MAVITILIEDMDLKKGTFKTKFTAEEDKLSEGQATAAYFTGYYLHSLVNTAEFGIACGQFGRTLYDAMQEDGVLPVASEIATMTLTLNDIDLDTGQYQSHLAGNRREEDVGKYLPSTAEIVGMYMQALLYKSEFNEQVWRFAREFCADHPGAEIGNDPGNEAANIAA